MITDTSLNQILPINLEKDFIDEVISTMPEMPEQKRERFISEYNLSNYDADLLALDKDLANFFEEVSKVSGSPKLSANWIMGDLSAQLNNENLNIQDSKISSEKLGELIIRINDGTISGKIAKDVFEKIWISGVKLMRLFKKKGSNK